MIDRGRSRGWTNKIKSRLSIVDRGGSWCWPYKVESSLGIVVWGWSSSYQLQQEVPQMGQYVQAQHSCMLAILGTQQPEPVSCDAPLQQQQ